MKFFIYKKCLILVFTLLTTLSFAKNLSRAQYIDKYKDIAIKQMNEYKIPASIILAQACLESGNGNSKLAMDANNHFGIKCSGNWSGKTYKHDDDKRRECFRKYSSAEDSFMDHSLFLTSGKRYSSLFDLKITDYKGWAHGLKAAGYATNPKYAKLLIDIIEEYELYKYDLEKPILSKKELRKLKKEQRKKEKEEKKRLKDQLKQNEIDVLKEQKIIIEELPSPYSYSVDNLIQKNNGVAYIVAKDGDTFSSIAEEHNLFINELLGFNDLSVVKEIEAGEIIYLQRKKKKGNEDSYRVQEGDTMYKLSQRFAIRLKNLYSINGMSVGEEPIPNSVLKLR